MYELMGLQITLPIERLIANIAAKWPCPTMNALMFLQMGLLNE
jgi:hypothetical protein